MRLSQIINKSCICTPYSGTYKGISLTLEFLNCVLCLHCPPINLTTYGKDEPCISLIVKNNKCSITIFALIAANSSALTNRGKRDTVQIERIERYFGGWPIG